ncbi:class I SAM-dependent methyltransferase [Pedobacter aquatilis]|uniref:class I SAM-dependent methyltransferase n=1 Tax=Pedobacter aquatilis TaxID=351343 RepID=UPI00292F4EF9|nr:methyltransferase domain-containing protein [Pedobacter aquatilis]
MDVAFIYDKINTRIRRVFYRTFLWKYNFGAPVAKGIWEKQFSEGTWDYLSLEDEQDHYLSVVKMYDDYVKGGSILDVGCGQGVLYSYLSKQEIPHSSYLGIDIASSAIQAAKTNHPNAAFQQLDFDSQSLLQKFDVIIFNETLYYFNRPLNTLKKCIAKNLNSGGLILISIVDYETNVFLLQKIKENYDRLGEEVVKNTHQQKWHICIFKP